MKFLPITPEIVGTMPEQMFTDIQAVIPVNDPSENYRGYTIRWDPDEFQSAKSGMLLDRVGPMVTRILEIERKRINFIEFSIANGIILPGEVQRDSGGLAPWHRDGDWFDGAHRYVTANVMPTEVKGRLKPEPYQLVRLGRVKHRSPANTTDTEVHRTWVRAEVFY